MKVESGRSVKVPENLAPISKEPSIGHVVKQRLDQIGFRSDEFVPAFRLAHFLRIMTDVVKGLILQRFDIVQIGEEQGFRRILVVNVTVQLGHTQTNQRLNVVLFC